MTPLDGASETKILAHGMPQVEVRVLTEGAAVRMGERQACANGPKRARRRWMATGIFLLVLAGYVLTSPGRIDIIDGQVRFEVAYNWLTQGRPIVRDPWVVASAAVKGRNGAAYSYYGAPGSVVSMPLVWLGLQGSAGNIQLSQFLFSLTSSIFGAGIASVMFLFYLELGATYPQALAWTLVCSFATYIWPISNSTFDNAQHAFFALAALYLGFLSARRRSWACAAAAGLMAGVLVLYQEYLLLIVPALALSVLGWPRGESSLAAQPACEIGPRFRRILSAFNRAVKGAPDLIRAAWDGPGEARSSLIRYFLFLASVGLGVTLSLAYNDLRFGSWLDNGKLRSLTQKNYPVFGNPLAGFLTILVSPGKSIFLYSPVLVLAFAGVRGLWRRTPGLAVAIAAASLILLSFISCITFAGGDWCWGPRYLMLLLPIWSLALPFAAEAGRRRGPTFALIVLGVLVQILGLSVENQRFFFERGLGDFFWAEDSWAYFKHSALAARVGEVASLSARVPAEAQRFTTSPPPSPVTYTLLGPIPPVPRKLTPVWMRNFQIFYLPRPWPLWMSWLPPEQRPIRVQRWLAGLFGVGVLGMGLIYRGWKAGKNQ